MKTDITFFMGNEVFNIFHLTIIFEKSKIFGENGVKNFWETWPFFRRKGRHRPKMNITPFIEN